MGEVFRARDPRLERDVAIKLLPAGVAKDPDRLRRFEVECRAAAALNHPNLLAIYDVGESPDGHPYIVSELLQGESLRNRLLKGKVPLRKAIEYAAQIARGLAAAHEKNIIHRDLKPENIFITEDGTAKILDFGLAKVNEPVPVVSSSDPTLVPTTEGTILGTVGYMSPEQARGERIDARTDIFSFGVVLYEMLSGKRAFQAQTSADTIAAILKEDPRPLDGVELSPALERIVRHCLEKSSQERFQSARDLAFHLESAMTTSSAVLPPEPQRSPQAKWIWFALPLAIVAGVVALRYAATRAEVRPGIEVSHLTAFVGLEEFPTLSPDGKYVAFVSDRSGTRQIMIRLLAGGAPLQITNDVADHRSPRWTADSSSILYYTPPNRVEEKDGTVWQVSALGGASRRLFASLSDADVSHDGTKVAYFALNGDQIELRVTGATGGESRLVRAFRSNQTYLHPRWSPDDTEIAFQNGDWPSGTVFRIAASGGEPKQLTRVLTQLRGYAWVPDGSGVVVSSAQGSTIYYQATLNLWFEPRDNGPERQLNFGEDSYVDPDIGRDGRLVASRTEAHYDLWKFPTDGTAQENVRNGVRLTRQTGLVQTPSVSPDGRYIVYLANDGGHGNLWVLDVSTGESRQLTFEQDPTKTVGVPIWSPDGSTIVYFVSFTGGWGRGAEWLVDPDGSNVRKLTDEAAYAAWSPDGKWLYYGEFRDGSSQGLRKISLTSKEVVKFRPDGERGLSPALSPDGKTLYFVVNSSGANGLIKSEIRAATPETAPSRLLAEISGSRIPTGVPVLQFVISPDGKWLATLLRGHNADEIWAIPTAGGEPRRLTDFGDRHTILARRVSWSADSKYIFAAVGEEDADIISMTNLVPGR